MKNLYWDSRKDGFKIFCCIAALNGLAFLCWRIPRLNPLMTKYFISRIDTGKFYGNELLIRLSIINQLFLFHRFDTNCANDFIKF